jgi:mono/diheme cytochrome c family protein
LYSCIVQVRLFLASFIAPLAAFAADASQEFSQSIRPVLHQHCAGCHNPSSPANRINFLSSNSLKDVEARRGLWWNVAIQLRNRTMPPVASKLTEADRMRVVNWVENRLRETACSTGEYAGAVAPRRLNRREYHHTIRDLLGVELSVADIFPADESGGAGFDTNGETLYVPPMLLEKYLEAAQKILDRVIVTPALSKTFPSAEMDPRLASDKPGRPLEPGQEVSADITIYVEGQYNLRISVERPHETPFQAELKVDGAPVGTLNYQQVDRNGGPTARIQVVNLDRGVHKVALANGKLPILFYSLTVEQRQQTVSPEKTALHYRLFGIEPGEAPLDPRKAARQVLQTFLRKAYRRPVDASEVDRFLALYDRAAQRGDPYEERVRLALKAVLVSSPFLFRVEERATEPGIRPLGQYDMASRLSYFLWSTMPDEELFGLAERGRLQDSKVLAQQVERMLDDPRSRAFAAAFVGQWLGTQDVGGRAVPLLTELQHYYTPEVAAELRQEPVMLFHHLVSRNRSLLELLTANYTFLTPRLAKFYQVDDRVKGFNGDGFQLTEWPDNRRAGVLGMASVLAMNSHYRQTSPVLRGAWVLDTLLGTPVPPPPPDVPPLEKAAKSEKGLSIKQILTRHRSDQSCSTCHNVMDPIGFGLENFDWMGRWRDHDATGQPVDASGTLPSGEKFTGPVELRDVLLGRKSDFLRHLTGKVLGFALGRTLQDGDLCTVQRLVDALEKDGYGARTLIREIVLSTPFRNTQGGIETVSSAKPQLKRSTRKLLGEK